MRGRERPRTPGRAGLNGHRVPAETPPDTVAEGRIER